MTFKSLMLVRVWVIILLAGVLTGCQHCAKRTVGVQGASKTTVSESGKAAFPKALAGIWVADRDGWVFSIQPDGTINRIFHTMGRSGVVAGRPNSYPLVANGTGSIIPGSWETDYNPITQILTVSIELSHFRWEVGPNVVEGSSLDTFVGKVSSDFSTWEAEWESWPDYNVSTDTIKNKNLQQDPDLFNQGTLKFIRTDLEHVKEVGDKIGNDTDRNIKK